jgi:hypothetical protein
MLWGRGALFLERGLYVFFSIFTELE